MNSHHSSLRLRALFAVAASLVVVLGLFLATRAPAAVAGETGGKYDLEAVAAGDLARSDTSAFIVQLPDPPIASYRGEKAGLDATSPSVLGSRKLDMNSAAVQAYRAYLSAEQDRALAAIEGALSRPVNVQFRYDVAYNGFALEMSGREAARVAALPNVAGVFPVRYERPDTLTTPDFIGANTIWNGSSTPGPGTQGEGIIVGILDTGINSDHPSFAEVGGDGYVHSNPLPGYVGVCDPGDPSFDPTFTCNDKLIGAWSFVTEGTTPEDSDGHGSHTASTAAGNVITATISAPTTALTGTFSGIAPHANIIAYDVCVTTCPTSATLAAVNQATADGVDVINYSISGGEDPYNEPTDFAFLSAADAGVFVSVSAGNGGPGPATIGHRGPWYTSVAASTHDRLISTSLVNMSGGGTPAPADMRGASLTTGYGPAPIVHASDFGDALCLNPFPAGTWSGEIVVCDRGIIARVAKGQNVLAGGAGGLVLANVDANGESINGDAHFLPATHIGDADGDVLRAWLASGTGHMAEITPYTVIRDSALGDMMASFSARGPNVTLDVLKPDVSGPGVDVLAAIDTTNPGDPPEIGPSSGTSMSSPHTAGAGALLSALYPSWSPSEIKSALMTTGITAMIKEDGVTTADPFDYGGGRIDLTQVARVGLVLDETTANYQAANPATGGDPRTLNLPSMYDSNCLQSCSWTRTVKSVSGVTNTYSVSVSDPSLLSVSPSSFQIAPGATQVITVTANTSGVAPDTWAFGQVQLQWASSPLAAGGPPTQHLPVAVFATAGVIPNEIVIETRRNSGSKLVEDLSSINITDLTIDVHGLEPARLTSQDLSEDPTNLDPYDNLNDGTVFYITETVSSGALRFIAEIIDTTSPDIDLYVGIDTGDGVPQPAEEVCVSASATAFEKCDLANPTAGTYWILVQNWSESGSPPDPTTLATVEIPVGDAGNMSVTGPTSVPAGTPFDIRVFWNTPTMVEGDRYYGEIDLGTDAGNPGNIGSIPVTIIRRADDVTKTGPTNAMAGEVVTYTLTVQPNIREVDLTYHVTDTLPAELTLVPGSATASAGTVSEAGNSVMWTGTMQAPGRAYVITTSDTDATCAMPLANSGSYTDLFGYGINANPGISGDTATFVWSTSGDPSSISFYGQDVGNDINFTMDGFAFFDPSTPGASPGSNTALPDPSDPNNLMALLWRDLEVVYDAGTNRGISLASLTSGGIATAHILEMDDVEPAPAGSTSIRFDAEWLIARGVDDAPGEYEVIFAYDNVQNMDAVGTIGLENATGTRAAQYAFNDAMVSGLTDGMAVCFDWAPASTAPVTITYQATIAAGASGSVTNTAVHDVDNPGAMADQAAHTVSVTPPTAVTLGALSVADRVGSLIVVQILALVTLLAGAVALRARRRPAA